MAYAVEEERNQSRGGGGGRGRSGQGGEAAATAAREVAAGGECGEPAAALARLAAQPPSLAPPNDDDAALPLAKERRATIPAAAPGAVRSRPPPLGLCMCVFSVSLAPRCPACVASRGRWMEQTVEGDGQVAATSSLAGGDATSPAPAKSFAKSAASAHALGTVPIAAASSRTASDDAAPWGLHPHVTLRAHPPTPPHPSHTHTHPLGIDRYFPPAARWQSLPPPLSSAVGASASLPPPLTAPFRKIVCTATPTCNPRKLAALWLRMPTHFTLTAAAVVEVAEGGAEGVGFHHCHHRRWWPLIRAAPNRAPRLGGGGRGG